MKRLISLCLVVVIAVAACWAGLTFRDSVQPNSWQSSASQPDSLPSDSTVVQEPVFNPPTLFSIAISPEARVKATATDDRRELWEAEWTTFQITIENAAGITAPLLIESDQLMRSETDTDRDHWLRLTLEPDGPLTGQSRETRALRLYSRDSGIRTALLNVNAGQGTQDLGFRSDVLLSFRIAESHHSSEAFVP